MSASGTVKFFNVQKGYGFIIQDDGSADVFVHNSDVNGNGLQDGDKVQFNVEFREDGRARATNVMGGTRQDNGYGNQGRNNRNGGYNNNNGYRGNNNNGYGGNQGGNQGGYGGNQGGYGGNQGGYGGNQGGYGGNQGGYGGNQGY